MVITVLRYTNETAFLNRMASIGFTKRVHEEGEGSPLMIFEEWEVNASPDVDEDNGEVFLSGMMEAKMADKFPPSNNPAFSLIWRSDVNAEDPWPTYSVEDVDENGVGLGTYHQQGIGGIA